jgi:hypothetical protein
MPTPDSFSSKLWSLAMKGVNPPTFVLQCGTSVKTNQAMESPQISPKVDVAADGEDEADGEAGIEVEAEALHFVGVQC